jgi:hypothetical protein
MSYRQYFCSKPRAVICAIFVYSAKQTIHVTIQKANFDSAEEGDAETTVTISTSIRACLQTSIKIYQIYCHNIDI